MIQDTPAFYNDEVEDVFYNFMREGQNLKNAFDIDQGIQIR